MQANLTKKASSGHEQRRKSEAGPFNPWVGLKRNDDFFENAEILKLVDRSMAYVDAGIPLHLAGNAGQGKTSLAMCIAKRRNRPITMFSGNIWLTSEDLIGKEVGTSKRSTVDRYVQSVRKSESQVRTIWQHSMLSTAMEYGHTVIYDEFTRSTPQTNSVLLSVLDEGVLISTDQANTRTYLSAHPDFRILLTSNPKEYAGINSSPDALLDRMITLHIQPFSIETQIGIVASRCRIDPELARKIVLTIAAFENRHDANAKPSIRAATIVGRVAKAMMERSELGEDDLQGIITDVMTSRNAASNNILNARRHNETDCRGVRT